MIVTLTILWRFLSTRTKTYVFVTQDGCDSDNFATH